MQSNQVIVSLVSLFWNILSFNGEEGGLLSILTGPSWPVFLVLCYLREFSQPCLSALYASGCWGSEEDSGSQMWRHRLVLLEFGWWKEDKEEFKVILAKTWSSRQSWVIRDPNFKNRKSPPPHTQHTQKASKQQPKEKQKFKKSQFWSHTYLSPAVSLINKTNLPDLASLKGPFRWHPLHQHPGALTLQLLLCTSNYKRRQRFQKANTLGENAMGGLGMEKARGVEMRVLKAFARVNGFLHMWSK